jgi:hypothetical protein
VHIDSKLDQLNVTHLILQLLSITEIHYEFSMGLSRQALLYSCLRLQGSAAQFATVLRGSMIGKVASLIKGHVKGGSRS